MQKNENPLNPFVVWPQNCGICMVPFKNWSVAQANSLQVSTGAPCFDASQQPRFSKETEYYWIPPSLATGEWTPTDPVRYAGDVDEAGA